MVEAQQQEKLRTIVNVAIKDLLPMRAQAVSARERGRVLLTQATIDRAAIEALRTEQMAVADAASKRFAHSCLDSWASPVIRVSGPNRAPL